MAAVRCEFADHRAALQWFLDHDAIRSRPRLVHALFLFCCSSPSPRDTAGRRWSPIVSRVTSHAPPTSLGQQRSAIGTPATRTVRFGRPIAQWTSAATAGGSDYWARQALIYALGYVGDLDAVIPHYLASSTQPGERRAVLANLRSRHRGDQHEHVRQARRGNRRAAERWRSPSAWATRSASLGVLVLGRAISAGDPLGACEAFEQAMRTARGVGSRFSSGSASLMGRPEATARRAADGARRHGRSPRPPRVRATDRSCPRRSDEAGLLLADAGRHERRRSPYSPPRSTGDADRGWYRVDDRTTC